MKVLFWVQHLLGIGHVRRAQLIAAALTAEGADVTVGYGGFPVPGVDFAGSRVASLPSLRAADASFRLVDEHGRPPDEAWRIRRRAAFEALADEVAPEVLLLETFPFGRRQFRFELAPLLERTGAIVACSVRDILVARADPAKELAMAKDARRWCRLVLVHGDPAVVPFGASFPQADRIADLIRYTGYVAPTMAAEAAGEDGRGEVLVSVGGGAVGERLLAVALEAAASSPLRWRLLAGYDLPDPVFAALRARAPTNVVVERARPDFPALLRRCRISISQAGYNTVADLMAAGCRAVLVPFAAPGQTEQTDRARLLAGRGLAQHLPEAALTPASLAAAVAAALAAPAPKLDVRLDGAGATARLLLAEMKVARRPNSGLSSPGRPHY